MMRVVLIVVLVVLALLFRKFVQPGNASKVSAKRNGYSGNESQHSWSGSYSLLDGKMEKKISSDEGIILVNVVTESGLISVKIKDEKGNIISEKNDIGTMSYKVEVKKRVTVYIEAEEHVGSFDIKG